MYLKYFKPFHKFRLAVCKYTFCTFYHWDKEEDFLVAFRGKKWLAFYKLQLILHVIYVSAMFLRLFLGNEKTGEKVMGLMWFSVFFTLANIRWNIKLDKEPYQIQNSFFLFEKKMSWDFSGKKSNEVKGCLAFLVLVEPSVSLLNFLVISAQTASPCFLPFLHSLTPYCGLSGNWTPPSMPTLVGLNLFEAWLIFHISVDGNVLPSYVYFTGTVSLLEYIRQVERITSIKKKLDAYQKVFVLNNHYNAFVRKVLAPILTAVLPLMQAVSVFASIRFSSKMKGMSGLMFPLILGDSILFNLVANTACEKIYKESAEVKEKLMVQAGRKGTLWRKKVKALGVMKIQFRDNYFDRGTTLKMQDFVMGMAVNLLIMTET